MSVLSTIDNEYLSFGLGRFTSQEESYILFRIRGLNPKAAARGAGFPNPIQAVIALSEREDIQEAIAYGREMSRQAAINAGAVEFTKDDATLMYFEAHAKSATALEEIRAIDSLVKLHGLASPEKKEIIITDKDQLKELGSDELVKLSGREIKLDPSQYTSEVGNG